MPEDISAATSGQEFIDATQNAVLEAVSGMISETETAADFTAPHAGEAFYLSAEFWVGMSFVLVVVGLGKPIGRLLKKMLIKRRDDIVDQISQAEKLHDDAQKLLAEYERKYVHVKDEIQALEEKSACETEFVKTRELAKLDNELNIRRREVENAISGSIAEIRQELSQKAGTQAVFLAKSYLTAFLDEEKEAALIDASIKNILKQIKAGKNSAA